jgi:hypothetical protein
MSVLRIMGRIGPKTPTCPKEIESVFEKIDGQEIQDGSQLEYRI